MATIRYVRVTKAEYDDADGTARNDKLSDRLKGEDRDIRKIWLTEADDGWRGWLAEING